MFWGFLNFTRKFMIPPIGKNVNDELIARALEYYDRGILVLPARRDKKAPALGSWKKYQTSKPTREETLQLFTEASKEYAGNLNIGAMLGPFSNACVMDFDSEAAVRWGVENGFFGIGPTVETGSGKFHIYTQYEDGVENLSGRPVPGFEFRAKNLFIMLPPSIHPVTGRPYKWVEGMGLDDIQLPKIPDVIKAEYGNHRAQRGVPGIDFEELINGTMSGNRHHSCIQLACVLFRKGLGFEDVLKLCLGWNARNRPPKAEEEIRIDVEDVYKRYYGGKDPKDGAHLFLLENYDTDVGNAQQFVRLHGDIIRYVPEFKKWMVWDGNRWVLDAVGEIEQLAKATLKQMRAAAEHLPDDTRAKLIKHSLASESARRIKAMVELARTEDGIPILQNQLDCDPYLFNVLNGTVDLRTGRLLKPNSAHYITKSSPIIYDPNAKCPQWKALLHKIMNGNERLMSFLKRAVGYSLTGDTREQGFIFSYGSGANGKSTFQNAILELMGDYGLQAPSSTFMVKHGNNAPATNDIARLRGIRFVSTIEVEDGQRLAESLIKQLTGQDKIVARFLYGEYFEFPPTFKIWMAGNHKPIIRGTDHAIWRRIYLVPFGVTIPETERDKTLPEKLRSELSGILNWAIEGVMEWQKEGLNPPDEVKAATDAYRKDMDIFAQWFNECCREVNQARTPNKDLYESYVTWCGQNNVYAVDNRRFIGCLEDRGFSKESTKDGVFWRGIGILF